MANILIAYFSRKGQVRPGHGAKLKKRGGKNENERF
jgi:hypothetical protein